MNCFGFSNSAVAWLNKYYPVPAERVTPKWPWAKAAKYALLKWKGLRVNVLRKYNLTKDVTGLYDGESGITVMEVVHSTCHLCVRAGEDKDGRTQCSDCPVVKRLGKDCYSCTKESDSLYYIWLKDNNPEPMIKALEKIYRKLKQNPGILSKQSSSIGSKI